MIKQISTILSIFFSTLSVKVKGAGRFILLSGLTGLIIGGSMIYLIIKLSQIAGEYIASLIPWDWAQESLIFSLITAAAGFIMLVMLFRYLFLILLSPILSYISEITERESTNQNVQSRFSFFNAASRSVRVNSRNLLRESIISSVLFFTGFIPILNLITVPVLFIVQAYFTGFGLMDYYLERHYSFKQSIDVVKTHKWASISVGGIFMLFMAIPVLGLILAPYFTTVTATRYLSTIQTTDPK